MADTFLPDTGARPRRLTRAGRLGINQRTIQVVLGCLWIVDAALQYQPAMFGPGLADQMITPMAHNQPAPLAWVITETAHFVRPDAGVWNFLIATLQLLIGAGLLFRRTVRPALTAMFAWCAVVWVVGEGLGQLLTGSASPLTGAPGAVLLYAAIGVLVWPRPPEAGAAGADGGVSTAAAARGPLGPAGALGGWAAFWILSAVLWLLPANRAASSLHDAVSNASSGQPGWYAHFLSALAGHVGGVGTGSAWALAAVSLVIGLGPLLVDRPAPFLAAGAVLSLAYWVVGQAFGGTLTGMGTDPSTGPLVVLLAVSLLPAVVRSGAPSGVRAPVAYAVARSPRLTPAAGAGVFAALLLSATYPVASAASSAAQAGSSAAPAGATTDQSGGSVPGMAMGSGSRAAGAGGKAAMPGMAGATDPSWHYTGPPLPAVETALLNTVYDETEQGHAMQTPQCTAPPTAAQSEAAMNLIMQTSAAVASYRNLSAAVAAGYVPITDTRYPIVHYIRLGDLKAGDVLDPNHVQSLVYAFTPNGPVLAAAMYLTPAAGVKGPMPGGCLTQWHAHTNLCMSLTTHVYSGFAPCPAGTFQLRTPEMLHVWQVPVPGGPLAMDPTDTQVVESAIMAQQQGLAPVTSGTTTPGFSPGAFGQPAT